MFTKYKKIPDRFILICQGFRVKDGTQMTQMPSAMQIFADFKKYIGLSSRRRRELLKFLKIRLRRQNLSFLPLRDDDILVKIEEKNLRKSALPKASASSACHPSLENHGF